MIARLRKNRFGPIGIDIGSRSVKLAQFSADGKQLVEASRWDLSDSDKNLSDAEQDERIVEALAQAREGRAFKGNDAVLCLNHRQLFLQNIRVSKSAQIPLDRTVQQEAAGRIPFPVAEAEIRYLEAADIRQGDAVMREVILMACHRPVLERLLSVIEQAKLRPVAVDVEPTSLVRTYTSQFRREEDRDVRTMYVHVGFQSTLVVIAQGDELLFVKYLDLGGKQFDEAVSRKLKMSIAESASLRRNNGDRRSDRQDPEITRSVADAMRPAVERLASELSMCVRYHSVTFRGRPLGRFVLGGGEASETLLEALTKRVGVAGELSDPFRMYSRSGKSGRTCYWDIAAGLALREICSSA
ncbi:MAG: pilus assembly protein PilM [Planctomycetaceae bacterium]|nr:pilus assembly protein PilM [Planctomycetales bacterium]MCB9924008.1 pilus assembly protein PilM [Planctomycetaceae bacterium]